MTIGDILVNTNRATLENLLPLTEVKTQEDFAKFEKKGYIVGITAEEFRKKYPLLPVENIYASYNILSPLYYCELDNPTIPIVLNLQIYGDKRLTVASESDEEFQKRVLSIAKAISEGDMKRIRSYLFSLEDSFRVSVLSRYVKNAEPSSELYDLFMRYYSLTDYGFQNLNESDIRKVLSGKSEKQKNKTARKLRGFPDTITIYRGEGSKSTSYTQSCSWTVSYKTACFFACRLPSEKDSAIISAKVSKSDIVEFFSERDEAEVLVLPSAVKSVQVDTLYGINSVEKEVFEILPLYQGGREDIRYLYEAYGKFDTHESGHDALHTLRVLFHALLLVEMEDLTLSDKETRMLMDAVIYHDIGRTNDDTDESHGKASRDIYAAEHESENPGTGFLIEYHCIDDAVARRDLEALSLPDDDRIWLLYTILKDADALDRVRFGLRYLDPKYLRNHTAHKLLPVAQLCLGQLTF